MAQTYEIYIHTDSSGETQKPTKPTDATKKKTAPTKLDKFAKGFSTAAGFITNPDSLIGKAKSEALVKLGGIGIIASAVVKITDSITTRATELNSVITGDSAGARNWETLKKQASIFFHPVSTVLSYNTARINMERLNQRNLMQLQMLGDSQVNQNYGRKV